MCLFIYTLSQVCNHMHFQNVSECVVARGILGFEKHSLTLTEPVFLFDTMRSTSRTPAYYSQTFCCRKLKAVRPVPKMCEECAGKHTTTGAPAEDQGPEDGGTVATSESGSSLSGVGNESSERSTPSSFWKMANPREMV